MIVKPTEQKLMEIVFECLQEHGVVNKLSNSTLYPDHVWATCTFFNVKNFMTFMKRLIFLKKFVFQYNFNELKIGVLI